MSESAKNTVTQASVNERIRQDHTDAFDVEEWAAKEFARSGTELAKSLRKMADRIEEGVQSVTIGRAAKAGGPYLADYENRADRLTNDLQCAWSSARPHRLFETAIEISQLRAEHAAR